MGRLIDSQTAYNVLTDYYHHSTDTQHAALREALGQVESVDAVPVVRCLDCRWWDALLASTAAPAYHECKVLKLMTTGTWYCASGERNDDDNGTD